ncbi:nuclear transport factor 2 family protein [Streptomyces sp. MUM 203J]|uniref:nuclear transport factor 2 family protein n=1 Tax=Streptomyces sp. MUM 203J TaxID=2791990 RepID=UPI001F04848A|nr:nuclear transport factor 2 family protein [Streptomyces sp. MUM 203J]MCH0540322.1 nuclear transport factor 2 family protein [Streptomyces sp. MUM 203J]
MEQNVIEKVNSFLRILERRDFSAARRMCTDKATVWQNDSTADQAIGERLRQFESFVTAVESLRYDVKRQFRHENEVLQQHVLRLEMTDGSRREINALLFFRFEGGLIDRIEEYHYAMPDECAGRTNP